MLLGDSKAARSLQRFDRTHVLKTRKWLNSLEHAGVIPSADHLIGQRGNAGRDLSAIRVDRPGTDGHDLRSN